ncbi:MAG TPA: hypothetical protein VLB89_10365 [Gaiellaceae bacterium]|nr:hypothetical protein [Gaiellaceae bacterium]
MRRLLLLAGAFAAAALLAPELASAHVSLYDYKFPLPLWVFLTGGALAVALSAPAAAFAVGKRRERTSRSFYRYFAPLHLGAIFTAFATLLLLDALAGGLFGSELFTANPLTMLVWVDFWVGLGIACALVGNLWDFVSPLNATGRALERLLARRDVAVRRYPERLGVWPSVVLLLGWSWTELVWSRGDRPRDLAWILIVYFLAQLVAMSVFGAELWLARGELFTVLARTFARFAPLELFVGGFDGDCRARRCRADDPERLNCPSCWLDAAQDQRGLRLRPYGAGVRREPGLGPGGGALVVALLATVVYDGFRSTNAYVSFHDSIDWGAGTAESIGSVTMLIVVSGFALAYIAICAVASLREERSIVRTAQRYAPTLIPIAAVYFIAHYFVYWFQVGQISLGNFADPFEREWVPDYNVWVTIPPGVIWAVQVALIVWGHVVAVIEAHRVSLDMHRRAGAAFLAQTPLVLLMVAYTFAGLWVLGTSLSGG